MMDNLIVMKKILFILSFSFFSLFSYSTSKGVTVPSKVMFGDLKLVIKADAKKIIAQNIERLTHNESYFKSVVKRADLYFPIIEKKLKEVGVPDDIKFLCIQESELIAKAVSSSNAVGYWQFKKATAQEVGLTVNSIVDERKNIASASLGAAKYIKKNNSKLNNWAYALLSYYTGLGGVQKYVKKKDLGASSMDITGTSHWYLLKFISHKLAFENEVGLEEQAIILTEYNKSEGLTISDIAKKYEVHKSDMLLYNVWIDYDKKIPTNIPVIIPTDNNSVKDVVVEGSKRPKLIDIILGSEKVDFDNLPSLFTINGVKAVVAKSGESFADIAEKVGKDELDILKYNELAGGVKAREGIHYFIEKKKKKAIVNFHTVEKGETIASIAQQYGVRSSNILHYNRMNYAAELKEYRVLWMRKKRPKSDPIVYDKPKEEVKEFIPIKELNSPKEISFPAYTEREVPEMVKEEEELVTDTLMITPEVEEVFDIDSDFEKEIKELDVEGVKVAEDEKQFLENKIESDTLSETERIAEVEKAVDDALFEIENFVSTEVVDEVEIESDVPEVSENTINIEAELPDENEEVKELLEEPIEDGVEKKHEEPKDNFKIHKVVKGETLYSLSKKYKYSVSELKELNQLTSNSLSIGQELKIPMVEKAIDKETIKEEISPVKPTTHTVVKGDTFYSISKKYKLSIKELQDLNDKADYTLSIGEVLKLVK